MLLCLELSWHFCQVEDISLKFFTLLWVHQISWSVAHATCLNQLQLCCIIFHNNEHHYCWLLLWYCVVKSSSYLLAMSNKNLVQLYVAQNTNHKSCSMRTLPSLAASCRLPLSAVTANDRKLGEGLWIRLDYCGVQVTCLCIAGCMNYSPSEAIAARCDTSWVLSQPQECIPLIVYKFIM